MSKGEWRQIDEDTEISSSGENGVNIRLFLSPFDVPDAIRGYYDEKDHLFHINLRYPVGTEEKQEERKISVEQDDIKHMKLCLGKNSGRVYEIILDVEALRAQKIKLEVIKQIDKAIEKAISKIEEEKSKKNRPPRFYYDFARKIIQNHSDEFSQNLPAAV